MIDCASWLDNSFSEDLPFSRLYARAHIYGVPFHVTAIEVVGGADSEQVASDPALQDDLDAAFAISGAGPLSEVRIEGYSGAYVLVLLPYAQ